MDRRVFLATILVGAPALAYSFDLSKIGNTSNTVRLKAGDVILAESNACLQLPKDPKDGDTVQIVVENTTLDQPCQIVYETTAIAGDREPLILDSTANFKLVFRNSSQNWELA